HDAQALGLELAASGPDAWVLESIEEWRKDQTVTVQVGPHEQDGAADRVQLDQIAGAAQVVEVETAVVAPAVRVEGRAAILEDTMRLDNVLPGRQKPRD